MTRDEAKRDLRWNIDFSESMLSNEYVIDEIYNEFENRKCNSCKYSSEEDGDKFECYFSRDFFGWDNVGLPIDFGCNRWEAK